MSIPKQAVGSAASAVFNEINEWYPLEGVPNLADHAKTLATAALTAAAPFIQAAALREFAHALTAMITVYAERTTEYDAGWVAGMTSAIAGLTARADQLEGETK